jgi:hypothetical protein
VNRKQNAQPNKRKREENLSKDGKWLSFPRVPHLLQYVSNGNYYGRIKLSGKLIRESLETTVWTTAKLRLADFLKERLEGRNKVSPPLFSEAVELFKRGLESDTRIKPQSKKYRLWCLKRIEKSWPGLWEHSRTQANSSEPVLIQIHSLKPFCSIWTGQK